MNAYAISIVILIINTLASRGEVKKKEEKNCFLLADSLWDVVWYVEIEP